MTPRRVSPRRFAGRSYRRIGRMGRRVLGGGTEAQTDAFGLHYAPNWPDPAHPPWLPLPDIGDHAVMCNVCRWQGEAFDGQQHVELSWCPACGANGRDRFLHWCMAERVRLNAGLRIIECSPRLGEGYRSAMSTWFFYRTSDYDMRVHKGNLQLDLQAIDLPDGCLDVMLCAHVLEHVPDTDKALEELRRVMAPGGHLLLQVPVLQPTTAPPEEPEFHGDNTPVFWRFGFDLTARLRDKGFRTDLLCTASLADAVRAGENPWRSWSGEFDVPAMVEGAIAEDLVVVADADIERVLGVEPGYMYLTWDCVLPMPDEPAPAAGEGRSAATAGSSRRRRTKVRAAAARAANGS
ncbi:MAG TPA: class I SAM-dependent methyltransferase, partial [Acidimicrobiales bacterium]